MSEFAELAAEMLDEHSVATGCEHTVADVARAIAVEADDFFGRALPATAASDVQIGNQVVWCSRPGHPGPYAHTHPYVSALCADGEHVTCTLIGVEMSTPDFCDCECGHVTDQSSATTTGGAA